MSFYRVSLCLSVCLSQSLFDSVLIPDLKQSEFKRTSSELEVTQTYTSIPEISLLISTWVSIPTPELDCLDTQISFSL